jgi:anti-sigma B factor antagonist
MQIKEVRVDQELTHLVLTGKLDVAGMAGADIKFTGYTAARRKPTLIDLSQVEFIASLGVGMLISCAKALQMHGAKMVLLSPSDPVEKVLKTLGIDQVIPIAYSLDEGLRLLGFSA